MRVLLLSILFIAIASCSRKWQTPQAAAPSPVAKIKAYKLDDAHSMDTLIRAIGNASIVLMGEAAHGGAEFYDFRAALSKRLIEEKGFRVLIVEGDLVQLHRVDHYIQGRADSAATVHYLENYPRWPAALWGNREFWHFINAVRGFNQSHKDPVSVYGMDLFNFSGVLDTLLPMIKNDTVKKAALQLQSCFAQYGRDAVAYGRSSRNNNACKETVEKLERVYAATVPALTKEREEFFVRRALSVLKAGEYYFRKRNETDEWNTRERYMMETIEKIRTHHGGNNAKIIVWAHNTHVGDAQYTDMPSRNRQNIGAMLRAAYGSSGKLFIIGMGAYAGTVRAARSWGGDYAPLPLTPARAGSIEDLLHKDAATDRIILSKDIIDNPSFRAPILHRAVGVLYGDSYVPSVIPKRYDAFVYFDKIRPVSEL
jgi:erythromycin esterase